MSYPTGKNLLDSAIKFALSTIPEEELQKLFASLGYDTDEVTLEMCIEAWDKFGEEFTKPFFSLAQDQLDDADKMKAVRKSLEIVRFLSLVPMARKGKIPPLTASLTNRNGTMRNRY